MKRILVVMISLALSVEFCWGSIRVEKLNGELLIKEPGKKAVVVKEKKNIGELVSGTKLKLLKGEGVIQP